MNHTSYSTRIIIYSPKLAQEFGSVTASILYHQLNYWFSKQKIFYKFLEPCPDHRHYKEGDSWTEELGFTIHEFRSAFDKMGIRYSSYAKYKKAEKDCRLFERNGKTYLFASYIDKRINITYYVKNWEYGQEASNLSSLTISSQNSYIESELELKFIETLRTYQIKDGKNITLSTQPVNGKTGYYLKIGEMVWNIEPQVSLGPREGVKVPSRADFVFYPAHNQVSSKPLVIFTDGWKYHKKRIPSDFSQRLAIIQSGTYWCWSITWNDLRNDYEHSLNGLDPGFNDKNFQTKQEETTKLYEHYGCLSLAALETKNSFEWLIHYLGDPQCDQWQNWGLLRTMSQYQPQTSITPQLLELWQSTGQEHINKGEIKAAMVKISDHLQINSLIHPKLHEQKDKNASLVVIELKHNQQQLLSKEEWEESLRLFNLYQFIPRLFVNINSEIENFSITPKQDILPFFKTKSKNRWQKIEELIMEEDLIPFLQLMIHHNWPLPEVGYELTDEKQKVIANAELAWIEYKIAITTTQEDINTFSKKEWQAILVENLESEFERINNIIKPF